jgi:hypothetical protein
MARFADALESNPAPTVLGDVSLRYEPSMLIGETPKAERSWRPTLAWLFGITLLLGAIGGALLSSATTLLAIPVLGGGLVLLVAVWLERFEKAQRRFIANFVTVSLRLDFASRISGYPNTLIVLFDDVRALELVEQSDGELCLLVDFEHQGRTLREVLVAYIPVVQRAEAERLERILRGAFGLGVPPSDSPAFSEESTFDPG